MKVKLVSDIHTEFDRDGGDRFCDYLSNDGVDLLIVAGDLTTKHYEKNLKTLCDRFKDVIYVMGNHDYWYGSFQGKRDLVASVAAELPNLHWLDNNRVQIGDHHFAGGTLWFERCIVRPNWPDFRYVSDGPEGIFEEFEKTYKFLNENVQKGDVVITHHMPSQQCVAPRWEGDDWNCYFVGDVEDIILRKEPSHWFFGHTHDARNLQIYATELVCNPRGYPGENVAFNPDLIIDLDLHKKYT